MLCTDIPTTVHYTLSLHDALPIFLMMQIGMFSIGLYAGDYLGISAQHQQLLRVFSMLFSIPLLYYCALPFYVAAFYSLDRKSTRLNSSHVRISYAVFCLKKKITIS